MATRLSDLLGDAPEGDEDDSWWDATDLGPDARFTSTEDEARERRARMRERTRASERKAKDEMRAAGRDPKTGERTGDGARERAGLWLRNPQKGGTLAGAGLGFLAYCCGVATLRYGTAGFTGWLSAKFINKPNPNLKPLRTAAPARPVYVD